MTWRSKKENVVVRSSAELQFRALAQGLCELMWLKNILNDLRINMERPLRLYWDNKAAINIAHNPIQYARTKNIESNRHFIKETLDEEIVCMSYAPFRGQLADVLMKGITQLKFSLWYFQAGNGRYPCPA